MRKLWNRVTYLPRRKEMLIEWMKTFWWINWRQFKKYIFLSSILMQNPRIPLPLKLFGLSVWVIIQMTLLNALSPSVHSLKWIVTFLAFSFLSWYTTQCLKHKSNCCPEHILGNLKMPNKTQLVCFLPSVLHLEGYYSTCLIKCRVIQLVVSGLHIAPSRVTCAPTPTSFQMPLSLFLSYYCC